MQRSLLFVFAALPFGTALGAQTLFAPPPERPTLFGKHGFVYGAAVGDFDADGALDVFLPGSAGSTYFQRKNRSYVPQPLSTPTPATHAVAADVDGDGDLDVLAGGLAGAATWLVNQAGTLTANPNLLPPGLIYQCAVVVDLGGSPRPEIAIGSLTGVFLLQQDATGRYQDVTPATFPTRSCSSIAAADFDADGDRDLAVAGALGVMILRQDTAGWTQVNLGQEPSLVLHAVDLNRDGAIDLVRTNAAGDVVVDLQSPPGWVRRTIERSVSLFPTVLVASDLDGDQDIDLVIAPGAGPSVPRVLLNDGAGNLSRTPSSVLRIAPDPLLAMATLTAADFDGDGDVDLLHMVSGSRSGNTVIPRLHQKEGPRWLESTGDRAYRADDRAFGSIVSPGGRVDVADLDADGDLDFVEDDGTVALQEPDGVPTLVAAIPALANTASAVLAIDLDGDGDADLARYEVGTLTQRITTWRNDGTGTFTAIGSTSTTPWPGAIVARLVGDLNGDGRSDAFLAMSTGFHHVLLSDGLGGLVESNGAISFLFEATVDAALADFDGDGDLDVVLANLETPTRPRSRLLRNQAGIFTDVTVATLPPVAGTESSIAVVPADLDGDGDVDLAFFGPTATSTSSRWLRNGGSGVFGQGGALPVAVGQPARARALAADVDGDGDLDLVAGPGVGTPLWVGENRAGVFVDVSSRLVLPSGMGSAIPQASRDFDHDGDLDLLVLGTGSGSGVDALVLLLGTARQIESGATPLAGANWDLEIVAEPGVAPRARIGWAFVGSGPARVLLPPLGTLLVDSTRLVELPQLVLPSPLGRATQRIAIPNVATLVGGPFAIQALIVDPLQGGRFSNALVERMR